MISRLEAEQKGQPYNPPADANKYEQLQRTQWQQRQEEYKHTIAGFDAQMAATRSLIEQAKQDVVNYTSRLKLTTEIETMRTKLEKEGWGSRLQTNLASDARTEILRLSDAARQQVQQQGHNLENIAAQRGVYMETWKDYLATNLVTHAQRPRPGRRGAQEGREGARAHHPHCARGRDRPQHRLGVDRLGSPERDTQRALRSAAAPLHPDADRRNGAGATPDR